MREQGKKRGKATDKLKKYNSGESKFPKVGFKSGGRTKLRGGGMSERGLGRAFMKGGKV